MIKRLINRMKRKQRKPVQMMTLNKDLFRILCGGKK